MSVTSKCHPVVCHFKTLKRFPYPCNPILTLINTRLDHYNSLYFGLGQSTFQLLQLPVVQNDAQLLTDTRKHDHISHITPVLDKKDWYSFFFLITFKHLNTLAQYNQFNLLSFTTSKDYCAAKCHIKINK